MHSVIVDDPVGAEDCNSLGLPCKMHD